MCTLALSSVFPSFKIINTCTYLLVCLLCVLHIDDCDVYSVEK